MRVGLVTSLHSNNKTEFKFEIFYLDVNPHDRKNDKNIIIMNMMEKFSNIFQWNWDKFTLKNKYDGYHSRNIVDLKSNLHTNTTNLYLTKIESKILK